MSQPRVVPCLDERELDSGRRKSCGFSSPERPGRWGSIWFPGCSRRVTRSPLPRGRLPRPGRCGRQARSRWSWTGWTAVRAAAPEAIVHEMTALSGMRSLRNPDKLFAATNALRTQGTDNLLAAAAEAGTRRIIAQSYAGAGPERRPGPVKTEDDPSDLRPIRTAVHSPAAIAHV